MRLRRLLTTFTSLLLLAAGADARDWVVPVDFPTIQQAIDAAADGDVIIVQPGSHAGATVDKAVAIRARGGTVHIVDGPVVSPTFGKAGFYFPGGGEGSGASIEGFTFTEIPLPVFSRGADDVSVIGNSMSYFLQGVTNWAYGTWGNRWEIADNKMNRMMTACGGGIGVFVGDFQGGTVTGNVVTRNTIRGLLRIPDGECGGYNAPGVTLYADFRGGALGATIQGNLVTKNHVVLKSPTPVVGLAPRLVSVSGIELSDSRDDPAYLVIFGNTITYNNLRGMEVPLSFNPDGVAGVNTIENNYTLPPPALADRHLLRKPSLSGPELPGPSPIR